MRRQELVQAGVTAREAEVLAAVAERLRNGEIAEQLVISVRTVESHIAALLSKLGAPDRSALISMGRQLCRDVAPPPLPQPVAAFLGREKELAAVAERIHAGHLVTLVGPGGVGKTRLALRAADACGGAYMADMATVDSGTSVAAAVARALRAHEQPGRTLEAALVETARQLDGLLIVDNCEHLVADVAHVVGELVTTSGLRVVATSREPLGVPGEVIFEVPPLPVPGPDAALEEVLGCDAVRLFGERARRVSAGFAVTAANAEVVATLCRRLDGLPLALELAAARTQAYAPEQLVTMLDRRFPLLADGPRTAPTRHRTLAAAIDWSYCALDDEERVLFERLAVFPAAFDFSAVEAVCARPPLAPASILRVFPRVLGKSLLTADRTADHAMRYRMLESLRGFAADRLPRPELEELRRAHAAYYLTLAEQAGAGLRGGEQQTWLALLRAEEPNLRAATEFCLDSADTRRALRFVAALALYWGDTGQRREAAGWIDTIAGPGADGVVACPEAVHGLSEASLLLLRSDVDQAQRLARTATDLAAVLGPPETAVAGLAAGWVLAYQGRRQDATRVLRDALHHFCEANRPWERAMALQGLAIATADPVEAAQHAAASASLFRAAGDRLRLANVLFTMADGVLNAVEAGSAGDLDAVERWLTESRDLAGAVGGEHDEVHARLGLARLRWARGEPERAHGLLEECLPSLQHLHDQRCAARVLHLLGRLAEMRGDTVEARDLLRRSAAAAEPAADDVILRDARRALARLDENGPGAP